MKKGITILIITLTALLVGLNKVNAMTLDGTIVKEVEIYNSGKTISNLFSSDYTARDYFNKNIINSNDGDVAVFVLSGYTGYYKQTSYDSSIQEYESLDLNNIIYSIKLINSSPSTNRCPSGTTARKTFASRSY